MAKTNDSETRKHRRVRRSNAIAEIQQLMRIHGVRVEDLLRPNYAPGEESTNSGRPIYRSPTGALWRSGPGRKPDWVNQILASDGDLSAFDVQGFL